MVPAVALDPTIYRRILDRLSVDALVHSHETGVAGAVLSADRHMCYTTGGYSCLLMVGVELGVVSR